MKSELLPLQKGIVYGPVRSRRLGNSLGINVSPSEIKLCSMDCRYCQYSWTGLHVGNAERFRGILPEPGDVASELRKALSSAAKRKIRVDSITFSGNGEPTLHPDFPEIVDSVIAVRDSFAPGAKIVCLSNSTTLGNERIFEALKRIDIPVMKLDAGGDDIFRKLNMPSCRVSFEEIVAGLEKFEGGLTIQSLFVRGDVDNCGKGAVGNYVAALKRIRPRELQIYTLDRVPADAGLAPVPAIRLKEIKKVVEREVKIPAVVYS